MQGFDLMFLWEHGDSVSHTVLILMLILSVGSWAVILAKGWTIFWLRRRYPKAIDSFWQAPDLATGLQRLSKVPNFAALAYHSIQAVQHFHGHDHESPHLDHQLSISELVTRALRQAINRASQSLENGQTFLASTGSTAPFIGLFGTVWGIHHALVNLGQQTQASMDKVTGPVGEALIMTALGLFVAIPAVLAFNAFNRTQRVIASDLDGFAHDLLTYFSLGRANSSAVDAALGKTSDKKPFANQANSASKVA